MSLRPPTATVRPHAKCRCWTVGRLRGSFRPAASRLSDDAGAEFPQRLPPPPFRPLDIIEAEQVEPWNVEPGFPHVRLQPGQQVSPAGGRGT